MNRSILIVICDFLLVSLLAFSTVDINKVSNPNTAKTITGLTPAVTNRVGGREDLGDVMRLALEEERKKQDALTAELSNTRLTASQQQALLSQRDQQLHAFQQQLRSREELAARLQEQQTNLLRQMTTAQSNIETLNQRLQATTLETVITKEEKAAQEAETRKESEQAAALRQQLLALQKSNQVVIAERERLAGQLQLTEAQKQAAAAQLALVKEDLNVQRMQNTNLAEGVKVLATKSSELTQEIRDNRPLAPNTIFNEFSTNRVVVSFFGVRPGFFGGEATRGKQTQTILATDGTNTVALCHEQDTLLTLAQQGTAWEEMTGTLAHDSAVQNINSLSFYGLDPRVAFMPVPESWAKASGCKAYELAKDPYKFSDAVVVGASGGYYGESKFQIDLTTPRYLKMDRNTLKGLFGKFNPSTGDLVFSKTGKLLGVMANNSYCILIRDFAPSETVRFGTDTRGQPIAETLSALYATVIGMPFKLQ